MNTYGLFFENIRQPYFVRIVKIQIRRGTLVYDELSFFNAPLSAASVRMES